jgi:hypothetical protein
VVLWTAGVVLVAVEVVLWDGGVVLWDGDVVPGLLVVDVVPVAAWLTPAGCGSCRLDPADPDPPPPAARATAGLEVVVTTTAVAIATNRWRTWPAAIRGCRSRRRIGASAS